MTDPAAYVRSLQVMNALVDPITRSAIRALELPAGSRGLDAGCGIGLEAVLLAEAVGPAGHVTGIDLAPEHVACAQGIVERVGPPGRIAVREGDLRALPFRDGVFDWAWAKDSVTDAPGLGLQALPLVQELARVVKPGGTVAILAWTSQMLLPGYPVLEARLNATSVGIAPLTRERPSGVSFPPRAGLAPWCRLEGACGPDVRG